MVKLIPAEERHIDQIAALTAITGYWDCTLKYNNLGISAHDFMCKYVVKSRLSFTTIAVNSEDSSIVLGVIVCGTKQEILNMYDFSTAIDSKITNLFKNITSFEITEGYHISTLVVAQNFRGKNLGKKLFEFAEARAKKLGCEVLSLFTFTCQTSAITFYLKMGMMIMNTFHRSSELPFPIVLYLEKSADLTNKLNYFESEQFEKIDLLQHF